MFILLITLASHYCNDADYSPFEMITKRKCFVDESLLIQMFVLSARELPNTAHMLVCGPRMGKSVNLDMMKRFFEAPDDPVRKKKNEKLFTNRSLKLEIARDMEQFRKYFGRYHVIFLNFSIALGETTYDGIINSIHREIRKTYETYRHLYDKKFQKSRSHGFQHHRDMFKKVYSGQVGFDFTDSLVILAEFLRECDVNKEIFLMVDDFDRPFQIADDNKAKPEEVAKRIESLLTHNMDVFRYAILTSPYKRNRKFAEIKKLYYCEEILSQKHRRPARMFFGFRDPQMQKLYEIFNVHSVEQDLIEERLRQFDGVYSVYNPDTVCHYLETRDVKVLERNMLEDNSI